MRKLLSITMLVLFLATGVHVGITAYSAQKEQETQATVTQTTQETTEPAEPEVVEETSEFSEDETTTTAAAEPATEKVPVGKTVTKSSTAPTEEFVDVSEVAVFQQQEVLVEDPVVEETEEAEEETEEAEEETTGYEPIYVDPLPPEGEDWIE